MKLLLNASTRIDWVGEDDFSWEQRLKLWPGEVMQAADHTLGILPFSPQLLWHRRPSDAPVAWTHTIRGQLQIVLFDLDL